MLKATDLKRKYDNNLPTINIYRPNIILKLPNGSFNTVDLNNL